MKIGAAFPLRYFAAQENYYWYVVATVSVGAFLALLDASIINIIMPTLQRYFHTPLAEVEWVAIAYLLALTGLMVTFGRLADAFGRGRMYNLGFLVFIIGSAACGLAPSLGFLIIFRVLQAVGAAMLQTTSVALIARTAPPDKLGRCVGIQGAAQALGLAVGPMVGGILVQYLSWRYVFYLSVPIGLVGAILALLILPGKRPKVEKIIFDYQGAILFAAAVGLFLYAITMGNDWGWGSWPFLGICAIVALLLGLFYFWEKRAADPLLDFSLFHNRSFTSGNISGLLSYVILYGVLFLLPYYLEWVRGYQPSQVGFLLLPIPLAIGAVAPLSGWLSDRLGPRGLSSVGLGLASVSSACMAFLSPASGYLEMLLTFFALGLGLGLFTPPNNSAIMGAAPPNRLSVAGGILNMARSLGMSLGVAVAGAVFAWGIVHYQGAGLAKVAGYDLAFRDGVIALAVLGGVGAVVSLAREKRGEGLEKKPA